MRQSFDKAFEIVIGLEGHLSNDPNDPGGLTVWGLSQRFNPMVNENTTIDEAKNIYLYRYWIPNKCDDYPYPLDIVLFDGAINPIHGGNQELISMNPESWQELLILRMERYMKYSDKKYVKGHVFRCIKLFRDIKNER